MGYGIKEYFGFSSFLGFNLLSARVDIHL